WVLGAGRVRKDRNACPTRQTPGCSPKLLARRRDRGGRRGQRGGGQLGRGDGVGLLVGGREVGVHELAAAVRRGVVRAGQRGGGHEVGIVRPVQVPRGGLEGRHRVL